MKKTIKVKIPKQLADRLDEKANSEGKTAAEIVERAITNFITKRRNDNG